MEQLKKMIRKLLFPKTYVVAVCALAAAGLLVYTFAVYGEEGPVAYFSYAFSAYALVIVCLGFVPAVKRARGCVSTLAEKNRHVNRYMTDLLFITRISLYLSLAMNLAYTVLKFVSGIYYRSAWLITLAAYYCLLMVLRFLLIRYVSRDVNDIALEWKRCRACGIILIFMNIILTGMVILVLYQGEGFVYAGYLIYAMAMYDFYTITMAVINLIKSMKHYRPVLMATKVINMAAALIAMLSLETAMITQFGEEGGDTFRHTMVAATGGSICVIMLGMAAWMICRATRALKDGETHSEM